ncbi:MAG: amidohydrolase family protein [Gemmatimonadales bacterium]
MRQGRRWHRVLWSGLLGAVLAASVVGCQGDPDNISILIDDVVLIDGTDRGAVPGMSIAINGDRIVAIRPTGEITADSVQVRIDGRGMYVIPGLWDMHTHQGAYRERGFPLYLANGVTTVRDVGTDLQQIGYWRQEVQAGRTLGPTIVMAGPILDDPTVVLMAPNGRVGLATAADAERVVDSLAAAGVDVIKVHSLLSREPYFAVLRQARKHGLAVVGHIPDEVTAREAIDSGQRTVEHSFGLAFENGAQAAAIRTAFQAEAAEIRATVSGREAVERVFANKVAAIDSAIAVTDTVAAREFAEYAAGKNVWFDPTFVVMQIRYRPNDPDLVDLPERRYALSGQRPPELPAERQVVDAGRARWKTFVASFAPMVRAGARFVAGTDVPVYPQVPGFSLHRELSALVEMGLTPLQAIQAATRNAAEAAGRSESGTVVEGKFADLVLLRLDPLADIGNTRTVETVVVRGKLLDRSVLDRLLETAEAAARQ